MSAVFAPGKYALPFIMMPPALFYYMVQARWVPHPRAMYCRMTQEDTPTSLQSPECCTRPQSLALKLSREPFCSGWLKISGGNSLENKQRMPLKGTHSGTILPCHSSLFANQQGERRWNRTWKKVLFPPPPPNSLKISPRMKEAARETSRPRGMMLWTRTAAVQRAEPVAAPFWRLCWKCLPMPSLRRTPNAHWLHRLWNSTGPLNYLRSMTYPTAGKLTPPWNFLLFPFPPLVCIFSVWTLLLPRSGTS